MHQHKIHIWHYFPVIIAKVDVEADDLSVSISPKFGSFLYDGMKLKIASLKIDDNFIILFI